MFRASGFPVVLIVSCTACFGLSAPSGSLPTVQQAQTDSYGGWAEVTVRDYAGGNSLEGELLAVSADSLWLFTSQGPHAIAAANIVDGKLTGYDSQPTRVGWLTTLGMVSTIGNGWILIATAPAWLITGSLAALHQSRLPVRMIRATTLQALAPFARFPAGLPPVPLNQLLPRNGR